MPFFIPHELPKELPVPGSAIERAVMDWKAVDDSTAFHKAKDVAAFANHLGGTILIGAHEVDGHLSAYPGMTPAKAGLAREAYSKAVEQKCQPHPRIDFAEYPHPDDATKRIVAVNVWPSLLLVGVQIDAHKPSENYGGISFVYPVRSGIDATYLKPGQLAMYMTPKVRRIAVLLSRVPIGTEIMIFRTANPASNGYGKRIEAVLEEQNVVTFTNDGDSQGTTHNIPLDCIETVYQTWDPSPKKHVWRMYINHV